MKLVVDTNVVYSVFSKDPFITEFIIENELSLFSVKELLEELVKDASKICKIIKCSFEEFEEIIGLFPEIIEFISSKQESLKKAESLISHKNDAPFLALALELNIPIWSNDRHFKEQSEIKVYTTEELKKLLSIKS